MAQTIHLRYFAAAADAAGIDEEEVVVGREATVADLRAEVETRHGAEMARVLDLCSFLLQGEPAELETKIPAESNVRIDVLPPFAGG